MRFLSSSLEPRVALEVGLNIEQRDRGGRLDVSLLNLIEHYLFVAETKVDFNKMMSEGRYESQMVAYETELSGIEDPSLKRAKFLVIGGREDELLPDSHELCSTGPRAKLFYDVLRKQRLFFFSTNALLALGLMKLFVSNEKYSLESLFDKISGGQYLGLLSCGLITKDGKIEDL